MGKVISIASGWTPPTLDVWLKEAANAKRWIIKELFPEDSIILISGQQKRTFKTYFALAASLCISTGKKMGPLTPEDGKGPVLFVEEEGAHAETRERILGLCKTLKIEQNRLNNFYFAFHQRVKLDNPGWVKSIRAHCHNTRPRLVIFDALTYLHNGDENKVPDIAPVVDALQDIRKEGGSVVLLAHTDKARGSDKKADIDDQVRGSSLIVNCYDMHLAFRRYKMSDAHIDLTVRSRGDEEKAYSVTWDIVTDKTREVNRIQKAEMSMREVVCESNPYYPQKCGEQLEAGRLYSPKELKRMWNCGQKTCDSVIGQLISNGALHQEDGAYRAA